MADFADRKLKGGVFDIGGVIAHDVWEGVYFHPSKGLAAQHKLDHAPLWNIGRELWRKFDTAPSRAEAIRPLRYEVMYWRAFVESVRQTFGVQLNARDIVGLTDSFITPVPEVLEVLARMNEAKIPIALCSNNNVFWFKRQWDKCELGRYLDASKAILSCDEGVAKAHASGKMFHRAIAVAGLSPDNLLYIDDRQENLVVAKRYGLTGAVFNAESDSRAEQSGVIRHLILGESRR
jgi:FMN phosphatase YigB (HAD superfamily)